MTRDAVPIFTRYRWSALNRRARRRLLGGTLLLVAALAYTGFAGVNLARRGADDRAFDRPLVRLAVRVNPLPPHLFMYQPQTAREVYLSAVIRDQRDMVLGLTAFVLRLIASVTVGGFGLILMTAGSIEWEVRSEAAAGMPPRPAAA
jgi:hypothetical protein